MKGMYTKAAIAIVALLALSATLPLSAKVSEEDDNTSPDASTTITTWKGSDPETFTDNTKFYLYNVGAGKFIQAGGLWNTEPMLVLQDYGMPFTYNKGKDVGNLDNKTISDKQNLLHSGMVTTKDAEYLGANVNGWTTSASTTTVHSAILDARKSGSFKNNGTVYYWRTFTISPVESGSGDYVLKETIHRFKSGGSEETHDVYIGAGWGTNASDVSGNKNRTHDLNHVAFKDVNHTNGSVTKDSVNYLWRFVTEKELGDVVEAQNGNNSGAYGGLNANVTYLLHDPNFDRAQTSFYNYDSDNGKMTTWTVTASSDVATTVDNTNNNPRWDWTYVDHSKNNINSLASPQNFTILPSGEYAADGVYGQPWNSPVLRKLEPSDGAWRNDTEKMNNIQYEMATLEGDGEAYQTVTFTSPGQYVFTAQAFAVGDSKVKGYLFARPDANPTSDDNRQTMSNVTPKVNLWMEGDSRGDKGSYWVNVGANVNWTTVAKQLDEGSNYSVSVLFNVPEASKDKPAKWRVGIGKEGSQKSKQNFEATRNYNGTNQLWYFYNDVNYVAIDNMQLHYLGPNAPFLFDEDSTKIDYMSSKTLNNGFSNRTTYLRRNAKINKWQPIVLPVSLTSEQVRQAFGDDVRLGKLEGVGKAADKKSPTSIDFSLVTLSSEKPAIEAWNYYLIYATKSPSDASWTETTKDNNGVSKTVTKGGKVYLLGRLDYNPKSISRSFNHDGTTSTGTKTIDNASFEDVIYGSKYSEDGRDPFNGGDKDLKVHGTWIKQENIAPAHAYYVTNGDMYYLSSPYTVKGFKWWITADESSSSTAKGLTFNFIDPNSRVVTYIAGVSVDRKAEEPHSSAVYNLAGQRVADDASAIGSLPKGVYITGGKKFINR